MGELNFSWMFPGGRVVDNRSTTALVNNTVKSESITVPANKRWLVIGGAMQNADNVTRICQAVVYNEADQLLFQIFYASLATTVRGYFPSEASDTYRTAICYPLILEAGQYAKLTWQAGGASTGGTAEFSFMVLEIDV